MAERATRRNPHRANRCCVQTMLGAMLCRMPDAAARRKRRRPIMCLPGCQEAVRAALSRRGFFKGAAAVGFVAAAAEPALARKAEARRSFKTAIDLTHTMSPEFPTFFGVPGIELQKQFDFKKDGFNLNWWRIIEHAGTHLDAPIHFSENGASAEKIVANELVVPLAVIDVRRQAEKNPDYLVSVEDVRNWEKSHGRLPDHCCVAMHSGWAGRVTDAARYTGKDAAGTFHFPGFSPELAGFLLKERQVAGLAADTLSLDNGASKDFKTHYLWLPAGRWGLENVANLEKLPAAGATLVVGIVKVKDATGGPARLFALV
jgi:kynurenine formamidase